MIIIFTMGSIRHHHQLTSISIVVVVLGALIAMAAAVPASSPKQCGSMVCKPEEYCSPVHDQCKPCARICNASTHNYDEHMCASECQHFIDDTRINDLNDTITRMQSKQNLTLMLLFILAFLFVLLNLVRGVRWLRRHDHLSLKCLKVWRSSRTNAGIGKAGEAGVNQLTHVNPHTQSPKAQQRTAAYANATAAGQTLGALQNGAGPALRGVQRQTSQAAFSDDGIDNLSTVHTVSTPISRYPAEDSTDNFSYDNAGLQVTPTTIQPPPHKSESKF